ncbi:MAG: hypothetical protein ABID61_01100 [Candidatus Micrarchaeota archaeon]
MSKKKRHRKKSVPTVEPKPEEGPKKFSIANLFGWSKLYISPKKLPDLVTELNGKGSLKNSYFYVLVFQIVQLLALALGYLLFHLLTMPVFSSADLVFMLFIFMVFVVMTVMIFYVRSWLLHFVSGLLGGKTDFGNQTYILSVLNLCQATILFPFLIFAYLSVTGILPVFLSTAIALVMVIGELYQLFSFYHVIKGITSLSSFRSAAVVLVVFVLFSLLSTILPRLMGV